MKTKIIGVTLTLAFLLVASSPTSIASNQKTFPSQTGAFVNALLTDYNSFITFQWRDNQTGFAVMQRFFPLYAPAGQTFRVIVAWAGPNDNISLNMMFIPIGGNTPVVVNDSNDYLANNFSPPNALNPCNQPSTSTTSTTSGTTGQGNSYQITATMNVCAFAQVRVNLTGNFDYATNPAFDYNGTTTNPVLAIGVRVANITGNYSALAQNGARSLYYDELAYGRSWLAANARTTTTTTQIQGSASGLSGWLVGGVIFAIGLIASIITIADSKTVRRFLRLSKKPPPEGKEQKLRERTDGER